MIEARKEKKIMAKRKLKGCNNKSKYISNHIKKEDNLPVALHRLLDVDKNKTKFIAYKRYV